MTDFVIMPSADYKAACDKIREKSGKTDPIKSGDLAAEIEGVDATKYLEEQHAQVSLPSATKLKPYAFYYDTTLTDISIPNVTEIGSGAFSDCSNLKNVYMPSVITLATMAFLKCSSLDHLTIPTTIKYIEWSALDSCTNLKTLTFVGTPEFISSASMIGCPNLTTINVPWAEGEVDGAPWGATNATINYGYTGG